MPGGSGRSDGGAPPRKSQRATRRSHVWGLRPPAQLLLPTAALFAAAACGGGHPEHQHLSCRRGPAAVDGVRARCAFAPLGTTIKPPWAQHKLPPPLLFQAVYQDEASAARAVEELDQSRLGSALLRMTLNSQAEPKTMVNIQGVPQDVGPEVVLHHCQQAGAVDKILRSNDTLFAEVEFKHFKQAWRAKQELDGSELLGRKITIELESSSDMLRKVLVHGISEDVNWQRLKDHFREAGQVTNTLIHGGRTAQVRFRDTRDASEAMRRFHKASIKGSGPLCVRRPWYLLRAGSEVRVRPLPQDVTIKDLVEHFSPVGKVLSADIQEYEPLPPELCD